jgi:hypothetical protein
MVIIGFSSLAKSVDKNSFKFFPEADTVTLPDSGIVIVPISSVKIKSSSK